MVTGTEWIEFTTDDSLVARNPGSQVVISRFEVIIGEKGVSRNLRNSFFYCSIYSSTVNPELTISNASSFPR